jgi:hypothetical protein
MKMEMATDIDMET